MKHIKNFRVFENFVDEDPLDNQDDFETGDFKDLEVIDDNEFDSPSLDDYEPYLDDEELSVDFDEFEEDDEEFINLSGDDEYDG